MGDLSLNPNTWTLGNFAEAGAEALTGSEFAGDVVGAVMSFATGDILGGVENVMDGAQNIASFAADPRVQQAASDAFGTGGTTPPSETTPSQQTQGYAPTNQTGAAQAGGSTSGAGSSNEAQTTSGTGGGLDLPANFASLPLEQKIMAILMALLGKKENELEEKTDNIASLKDGKTVGGKSEQVAMNELQQSQQNLSLLNNMITNIMKSFKDSQDAVIRNIR